MLSVDQLLEATMLPTIQCSSVHVIPVCFPPSALHDLQQQRPRAAVWPDREDAGVRPRQAPASSSVSATSLLLLLSPKQQQQPRGSKRWAVTVWPAAWVGTGPSTRPCSRSCLWASTSWLSGTVYLIWLYQSTLWHYVLSSPCVFLQYSSCWAVSLCGAICLEVIITLCQYFLKLFCLHAGNWKWAEMLITATFAAGDWSCWGPVSFSPKYMNYVTVKSKKMTIAAQHLFPPKRPIWIFLFFTSCGAIHF